MLLASMDVASGKMLDYEPLHKGARLLCALCLVSIRRCLLLFSFAVICIAPAFSRVPPRRVKSLLPFHAFEPPMLRWR